jgi:DNA-binding NarL/FixJ family response regulator
VTAVAEATTAVVVVSDGPRGWEALAGELGEGGRFRPVGPELVGTPGAAVVVVEVATPDALRRLAAEAPRPTGARVVVVSALPPEVALLPAMAAGARAFLHKPLEPGFLATAVSWVLEGHRVVDPRSTAWLVELALHGHRSVDGGLTLRQSQVASLVRGGLTNRQIAHVLGVSPETVKTHLHEAMRRLGATDRSAVAVVAARLRDDPVTRDEPVTRDDPATRDDAATGGTP